MNSPLIQIQHLSKSFGERTILQDATLDIRRNEITALIGKSGTGKSVLVKHIIGLLKSDSGDIIFDGVPYNGISGSQFAAIKNRCSYMFQNNALFDSLTVFENIALPLREKSNLSRREIDAKVSARIEQLELSEVSDMYPKQISGGMQKRVALARALVTEPEIIFFDEPTTGLDPIRKKAVFSMIHHYHERFNFTAVIITHDIPDIFYIAHTVHILDEGRIIFSGTPVELEQSHNPVLTAYTRGHEMLIDELTGLKTRRTLIQTLSSYGANSDRMVLATVRLQGLRLIVDYKGHLLAHTLISKFAQFVKSILPENGCAGSFSQEILVAAVDTDTPQTLEALLEQLHSFFHDPEIESFCNTHKLQIDITGTVAEKTCNICDLVHQALIPPKKKL